jgi:hypothetical protein
LDRASGQQKSVTEDRNSLSNPDFSVLDHFGTIVIKDVLRRGVQSSLKLQHLYLQFGHLLERRHYQLVHSK